MEWIAAAIVFVFLMWKWPRNTLIGLGVCVLAVGGWILYMFSEEEYQTAQQNKLYAGIERDGVVSVANCGDKYPLLVRFKNNTQKTITKIVWRPSVRRSGHSSELNEYSYIDEYTNDKILQPGDATRDCWTLPRLKTNDFRNVIVDIELHSVSTKE